jgi:MacB-like periplasmic core domain
VSIDGGVEPTTEGQLVSGNYFSLLGVSPTVGRAIGPEDDIIPNGHAVAMISHGYWQRRFGLQPEIVGRKIWISVASPSSALLHLSSSAWKWAELPTSSFR